MAAQQQPPRFKTLMEGLGKLNTEPSDNPDANLITVPKLPSPRPSTFDERLCQEMAAALFRLQGVCPLTYFRDDKAYLQIRPPQDPESVLSDIRQFAISFVYYFCTTAGPDPNEPVPEVAMTTARNRMHNVVKGNRTLEARLEGSY